MPKTLDHSTQADGRFLEQGTVCEMKALRSLCSPKRRLSPAPFLAAVIVVYAAGVASQWLTVPDIVVHAGFYPFGIVQAVLISIWFVLHAQRLHDAHCAAGIAGAAAILYALSVALLVLVAQAYLSPGATGASDTETPSALGLILLVWIISTLAASSSYGLIWVVVIILLVLAFVPALVAIAVTVWAATRPVGEL